MSRENVGVVRSVLAAWGRYEESSVLPLLDPKVVFDATRRRVNPKTYVGMEGLRRMLADRDEVGEEFRTEPDEFLDAGDRVVVIGRWGGNGEGSVAGGQEPTARLFSIRDGAVLRLEFGRQREGGLKAAGLSE